MPISDRLNAATKYVATHRPETLEWGPFKGVGPDIVEDVRRIKSQDGRIFAEGIPARSFELVSTQATPSGVILNTYKVAGPLKKG